MTSGRRLEALMDAMSETALTPTQRYVVLCLARYADHKTGRNARPGLRTIADDARCKVETAQNALARAEEIGIVAAAHRAPGRVTTWTVLPEPSPETGQQVSPQSGQDCPPTVPPLSRNGDTTTETTGLYGTPPRDESSETHTRPTTGAGAHEHLTEQLAARTIAGTPTTTDRHHLDAFARLAHREGLTADDVLHVAKDPRPAALAKNAALVIADAKAQRPHHESMADLADRATAAHAAAARGDDR